MLPKTIGNYAVREDSRPEEPFRRIILTALDDTSFTREVYVDRAFELVYPQNYQPLASHLYAYASHLDEGRVCQSNQTT